MKRIFSIVLFFVFALVVQGFAQADTSYLRIIDSIEQSFKYQTGQISIPEGKASMLVPKGFRYLDKEQANYVLTDLWGNPKSEGLLGMLVPENVGILDSNAWIFTVSYDEMGYVKDEDANDINYDDLLKEQQDATIEGNAERIKNNYDPITLVGWASPPYYDSNKKVLHWAKELKFGDLTTHTLNYNMRILGRKGIFLINAVADMRELPLIKRNVNAILSSVTFDEGSKYSDFNPELDEVAAYTVGGLVAGKVLAKAGFFVVLAKFWKFILFGLIAFGGFIMKFFKKSEEQPTEATTEQVSSENDPDQNA
jgi:uncharacterized membrane-anchored protein